MFSRLTTRVARRGFSAVTLPPTIPLGGIPKKFKPSYFYSAPLSAEKAQEIKEILEHHGATVDRDLTGFSYTLMSPDGKTTVAQKFSENLALFIAYSAGEQKPIDYLHQLYAKEVPANETEAKMMDFICGIQGTARSLGRPFHLQVNKEFMTEIETKLLEPVYADPEFASKLEEFGFEIRSRSAAHEYYDHDFIYTKVFIIGLPFLIGLFLTTFWGEFAHIRHMKHDQHERVEKLLKEEH